MQIAVSSDVSAFARDWPAMADHAGAAMHVFQARDYLEAWRGTIGAARQARMAFVRVLDDARRPVMFIPLAIERRRGLRFLGFPDGGVCDYCAPVLFPAAGAIGPREMRAIWARIAAALPPFDVAMFEKTPPDVGGIANPFVHLTPTPWSSPAYAVALTGDWESFVANRLHRPKDSRRKRRRLAEMGALRFLVAREPAARQRVLDALIRQKTRRYLETRGRDGFDRPGYRDYFRHMTTAFSADAHLSALTLDDEIIATHWGLVSGGAFYCLMLSTEACEAARYSPGRILIEELIAWSYRNELTRFDLGIGEAIWKDRLGDVVEAALYRGAVPNTLAGAAYVEAARLRRALRGAQRARAG